MISLKCLLAERGLYVKISIQRAGIVNVELEEVGRGDVDVTVCVCDGGLKVEQGGRGVVQVRESNDLALNLGGIKAM